MFTVSMYGTKFAFFFVKSSLRIRCIRSHIMSYSLRVRLFSKDGLYKGIHLICDTFMRMEGWYFCDVRVAFVSGVNWANTADDFCDCL